MRKSVLFFRLRQYGNPTTDVARSVVGVSVCWGHGWAMQKRQNRSKWRLEADSCGSKEPCILDAVQIGRIHSHPWGVTGRLYGLRQVTLGICLNVEFPSVTVVYIAAKFESPFFENCVATSVLSLKLKLMYLFFLTKLYFFNFYLLLLFASFV